MAEVTRKLLVIECCDEMAANEITTFCIQEGAAVYPVVCSVPTAEQLGRVALDHIIAHCAAPVAFAGSLDALGQAILDALTKGAK